MVWYCCIIVFVSQSFAGPGLALHGPIGSMARAAAGMRNEIKSTFVAYVLMIASLAVGLLMSFWILMDWKASTVSSIVLVYSVSMWWRYCSRIYNKFYLEDILAMAQSDFGQKQDSLEMHGLSHVEKIDPSKEILKDGYLSELTLRRSNSRWERRYYVVDSSGNLWCYSSKQSYLDDSTKNLKEPVNIKRYSLHMGDGDRTMKLLCNAEGENEIRTELKFRFDTDEELMEWEIVCRSVLTT